MCAWREGGCAYGRGGVCVHEEREGVYMEGVECAWGQGGCVYGRGGVCVHGEREGVHMEGVECVCMGRELTRLSLSYNSGGHNICKAAST